VLPLVVACLRPFLHLGRISRPVPVVLFWDWLPMPAMSTMESYVTNCQTCGDLLADYKHAVSLFKNAVRDGNLLRVSEDAEHLAQHCKNCNDALKA
jgi:hypothetical protein